MNAMTADRDLLFGLLALQIGLIDQDGLTAAFRAWTRDKSRAIADYLADRGDLDADDRAAVDALVSRHLKKHGGSAEKSLSSIPAAISTKESLARIGDPELKGRLSQIGGQTPASLAPLDALADADLDRTAAYSVGTATSDGQRFRILRPHARGGLGAIFVALDEELHREVALKQILDQHVDDPVSRQRFVLEAEITGSLEHPGIVPVYGLGTYGDGRPFYAMRFIRGDSLKEAVDGFHADLGLKKDPGRRSLELRHLLGRFVAVCNAIEYAHGRGVLHRDIKPANIIVGKHGETLVVDWGLAKALGRVEPGVDSGERILMPSSASGSSSTLPGSALGTPAYMSPEQSEGDIESLGPRSDIYSLGATLYYLLTGKPPLEGELFDVIRRVQKGQIPPPRELDTSIDRALESVCLKAMAVKPEDRYGSARALADDVERWMADEPVSSWREPWTRGLVRWLTRHRVGVTAMGAAVLVALLGTGAVLAVQTRANGELHTANLELALANAKVLQANTDLAASNEREKTRFALAQEAIRTFHSGVSDDILLKEEQFKALRTKLLRGAREFYRKLEALLKGQQDAESRLALGKSYFEVGELTRQIDSITDAGELYERADRLFEDLLRENPLDAEPRRAEAQSLKSLSLVYTAVGRLEDALATIERSRDMLRSLALAHPADRRLQLEWADVEMLLASGMIRVHRPPSEVDASAKRVRSILETVTASDPGSKDLQPLMRDLYSTLGHALEDAGRAEEAAAAYQRASDLGEKVLQANPGDPLDSHELARNLGNMAIWLESLGRVDEALVAYERAREVLKVAAAANPTTYRFTADMAWIESLVVDVLLARGRTADALAALERAKTARELLIKANPAIVRNREQLVRVHRQMADVHRRAGRMPEVFASLEAARDLTAGLARTNPQDRDYQADLALAYTDLGAFHATTGKPSEAQSCFEQALVIQRRLIEAHPSTSSYQSNLAGTLRHRGVALERCGQASKAAADFRESIAILKGLAKPAPQDYYNLACGLSLLSGLAQAAAPVVTAADGRAAADEAIKALRQAVAAGYRGLASAKTDTDLDPIRSRGDFQALLEDMGFPVKPFAAPK